MAAIYYSGPNREQLTADESELPGLLASGAVSGETLVWKEGMADWQPLRVVRPDLAGAGAARARDFVLSAGSARTRHMPAPARHRSLGNMEQSQCHCKQQRRSRLHGNPPAR